VRSSLCLCLCMHALAGLCMAAASALLARHGTGVYEYPGLLPSNSTLASNLAFWQHPVDQPWILLGSVLYGDLFFVQKCF
jgi:hypothetical protein